MEAQPRRGIHSILHRFQSERHLMLEGKEDAGKARVSAALSLDLR